MSVRIIVADRRPVVRLGIASSLKERRIEIVGVADSAASTIQKTIALDPQVLVIDATFDDDSGFNVIQTLRENKFEGRIVVFETKGVPGDLARAAIAGADSYVLKTESVDVLFETILGLAALERGQEANDELARELAKARPYTKKRPVAALDPLTVREAQVLRLIAFGMSNKEIAQALRLSLDTVKEYVQNVLRKLDCNDRTQAAVWAVRNKQIP